ncbi:MAG TPA: cytochrome c oxidase assembly protein [Rhizomicrobium sp.]|jgi:cytochrome c oxidase assembly factor CtaG|nr:cytochrome c oxidase assembly protein [Rhizomicrobium sp.]
MSAPPELGWEFDPFVVVPLALAAALYGRGAHLLWKRAGFGRGVTHAQALSFAAGWLALVVALVSPLHELGEHLFVAHMTEHELLMAVAAPLLALSRPLGTFLCALPRSWRLSLIDAAGSRIVQPVWRTLMMPLVATVVHGIAIWIWHVPSLLDATLVSENLHRLQHISFLVTALVFWWAILRRPKQDYGLGAMHVFATMVHTSLLGALLTLAPRVFYPLQTADAPLFGLTPLEDQQLAGLFMWVPGGAIYLAAGLALAAAWLASPKPAIRDRKSIHPLPATLDPAKPAPPLAETG